MPQLLGGTLGRSLGCEQAGCGSVTPREPRCGKASNAQEQGVPEGAGGGEKLNTEARSTDVGARGLGVTKASGKGPEG